HRGRVARPAGEDRVHDRGNRLHDPLLTAEPGIRSIAARHNAAAHRLRVTWCRPDPHATRPALLLQQSRVTPARLPPPRSALDQPDEAGHVSPRSPPRDPG